MHGDSSPSPNPPGTDKKRTSFSFLGAQTVVRQVAYGGKNGDKEIVFVRVCVRADYYEKVMARGKDKLGGEKR